ncbi:hypothetical protein [Streptomyces sp. NPDC000983]|uniref:hypothetical protein n=1 Tax=Streptomyces sp. NPDC000983 TaxID=3154373 RepID=UPI00331CD244
MTISAVPASEAVPVHPVEHFATGRRDTGLPVARTAVKTSWASVAHTFEDEPAGPGYMVPAGGLDTSDDVGPRPTSRPGDPTGTPAAARHAHPVNSGVDKSCPNSWLAPVAAPPLRAGPRTPGTAPRVPPRTALTTEPHVVRHRAA